MCPPASSARAGQSTPRSPPYPAARFSDLLTRRGLPVFGTRVLGVGLAFKPGVADDRESPAVQVLEELARRGAEVLAWDPLVDSSRIAGYGFIPVEGDRVPADVALAVILTDHDLFDYPAIAASVPVVFDARGAYARRGLAADNVVAL